MRKLSESVGIFALAIFLVAVIAALTFALFYYKKTPATAPGTQTGAQPLPVYAPEGELTPGFPEELILGGESAPAGSYAIDYSAGPDLRTAAFDSRRSTSALFNLYKAYFKDNGWLITNETVKYENSRGIYAVKSGAVASVAITDSGETRRVTVNYSGK